MKKCNEEVKKGIENSKKLRMFLNKKVNKFEIRANIVNV